MNEPTCIVYQTYSQLAELIDSGRLTHPRARRRAEDLLDLIKDVCTGSGGPDHLPAILKAVATIVSRRTGGVLRRNKANRGTTALESHLEIFCQPY